jgi:hypothetical protein
MAASAALTSSGAPPFGVPAFGVFCGAVEKVFAGDESPLLCEKACFAIPQTEIRVAAQKTLKISERNKEIPNRKNLSTTLSVYRSQLLLGLLSNLRNQCLTHQ